MFLIVDAIFFLNLNDILLIRNIPVPSNLSLDFIPNAERKLITNLGFFSIILIRDSGKHLGELQSKPWHLGCRYDICLISSSFVNYELRHAYMKNTIWFFC